MTLYLIKVMICSGVLLLAYHLLLEKEKMFRYNRFYLLFTLIISLVTPVVNFEWYEEKSSFSEPVYIMNELLETTKELIHTTGAPEQETTSNIPVVLVIYLVVASVLLVRFTRNLLSLFLQTKSMATVSYNGINFVLLEQKGLPFSFFHSIFVNKNDWHNGTIRPEILHHE
ncbi:MAG TPA: hypothetical protein VER36_06060, partial [Flavisolibacter sp.]|nr:hypothetical protein [Flavisolibacter sp.]